MTLYFESVVAGLCNNGGGLFPKKKKGSQEGQGRREGERETTHPELFLF